MKLATHELSINDLCHELAVAGEALVAAGRKGLGRLCLSSADKLGDFRPIRSDVVEAREVLSQARRARAILGA